MPHLADAALRRLYDEPSAATDAEQRHLRECAGCSARSTVVASRAERTHSALRSEAQPPLNLASARAIVEARSLAAAAALHRPAPSRAATLAFCASAAALVLVLLVVLTPLRTVAANFLAIFEPREIVAIPVTRQDLEQLRALPNLRTFGTVREGPPPATATVPTARAAGRLARMNVVVPSMLPRGAGSAVYHVRGAESAAFTFNAAKARAAAQALGRPFPEMPPGIDGSTLLATIGPVVVAVYGVPPHFNASRHRHDIRVPKLLVVQAPVPQIGSTGASARDIESYLLAQPGVPPQLAAEIRAIGDPSTTLPIPVPIDKAYATPVTVQGMHGLAVGDNTGLGSGVMWQRNGMIFAVAGPMPMSEMMAVANSLR